MRFPVNRTILGGGTPTKSTALLTPEEVDQAVKKQMKYRPPDA